MEEKGMNVLDRTVTDKAFVQESTPVQETGSQSIVNKMLKLPHKITEVLKQALPITITIETEWVTPSQEDDIFPEYNRARVELAPPVNIPSQEESLHMEEVEAPPPKEETSSTEIACLSGERPNVSQGESPRMAEEIGAFSPQKETSSVEIACLSGKGTHAFQERGFHKKEKYPPSSKVEKTHKVKKEKKAKQKKHGDRVKGDKKHSHRHKKKHGSKRR
jgi:hypothetical protein